MFSFTSTLACPAAKDLRPCLCINRKLTSSRSFQVFSFHSLNGSKDGSPPPPLHPLSKTLSLDPRNLVNLQRTFGLVLRNVRYSASAALYLASGLADQVPFSLPAPWRKAEIQNLGRVCITVGVLVVYCWVSASRIECSACGIGT